jgi:hypothetical protein
MLAKVFLQNLLPFLFNGGYSVAAARALLYMRLSDLSTENTFDFVRYKVR